MLLRTAQPGSPGGWLVSEPGDKAPRHVWGQNHALLLQTWEDCGQMGTILDAPAGTNRSRGWLNGETRGVCAPWLDMPTALQAPAWAP